MPQIINTNIASINAQRNLDKSQSANQQALQRLSSGLRINSAKDDAAGMAISTRFTSQIKGLNVAVRNAGDGIALAQTAEGALGSMNDNLQRIRELAVQSANATNSDVDREALQAEVEQLVAEISRTADETDFNGRKLLDGSFKATFQIGANAGQTLDVSIAELTADKLGSSKQAGVSAQGTDQKLSNGDLVINGEAIRASVSGDDELSYTDKDKSAISKAAAINASSDLTGVKATADENVVLGSKIETNTDTPPEAVSGSIKLNGVEIALQGTDNTSEIAKAGTRNSVITAINAASGQTGVVAEDGGANGGVILKAADGRNITIELSGSTDNEDLANLGLAESGTNYAGFTLTAANASTPIKIEGGNGTGNGDIANAGLKVGDYKAQTAATTSTGITAKSEFAEMRESISSPVTVNATSNAAYTTLNTTTLDGFDSAAGTTVASVVAEIGNVMHATTGIGGYADQFTAVGATSPLVGTAPLGPTVGATEAAPTTTPPAGAVLEIDASGAFSTNTLTYAQNYLNGLSAHLGLESSQFQMGTVTPGADAAGSQNNLTDAMAAQVSAMVTAFNAANTNTEVMGFDYAKLSTALQDLGVPAASIGTTVPAIAVAATTTVAQLTTLLTNTATGTPPGAGIDPDKLPASWSDTVTSGKTIGEYGLNALAADLAAIKVATSDGSAAQGEATKRALQDGDLVINGVTIGASSALDDSASNTAALSSDGAASAIAIAAAINKSYDSTGVKAAVNANEYVGGAATGTVSDSTKGSSLTFTLNGVDISLIDQGDYEKNKAAAISAINERAGETGVTAKDNGVSLTLTAADGRNISMYAESAAAPNKDVDGATTGTAETKIANFGLTGLDTANSVVGAGIGAKEGAVTVYGTVTLTSSKAFDVSFGTGGAEGLADSGLVAGKFGGGEDGQALTEIDISTFEGAQAALVAVDNAIAQVASQRADLGAIQNRMESTVSNLKVTSENLSAANSRIQDADFAAETAELSRTQVLQQAGISILAQANASGQNVLSLLG